MSLTLNQKTNWEGVPKPGELIEITGAHALEASDRVLINLLYQIAHDSGDLANPEAKWEVPLVRLRFSKHESSDRLRDCFDRLLRVVVAVPYVHNGKRRTLMTHLFQFFDLPDADTDLGSIVRFGLPPELLPILVRSNRWGRIKAEVVCAMSSRYAMALYELVQLRANLDRNYEVFPIETFRSLLGVPPGSYQRGNNLVQRVIEPALLEVNGLSDMDVKLEIKRRSVRAPIDSVSVSWWRKESEAFRAALRERQQSKVGRSARLRGQAEEVIVGERVNTDARSMFDP